MDLSFNKIGEYGLEKLINYINEDERIEQRLKRSPMCENSDPNKMRSLPRYRINNELSDWNSPNCIWICFAR